MKTKLKYFTMAIVALLMVGVSSCSSDDTPDIDTSESKSVFLKISNGPNTRAEGPTQVAEAVAFNSGHLYFTDANGIIIKYNKIAAGETGDYTIGGLKKGQTINNLPGSVAKVYVVGNTTDLPTTGHISAVYHKNLAIASQVQTTKGNVVNLYGEALLTGPAATSSNLYTAEVAVNPTVARIELTDITASGIITDFKVAGIFVDNYYANAYVEGSLVGDIVNNGEDADHFGGTSNKYSDDKVNAIHDTTSKKAEGSLLKVLPETGAVWGYNLFATNEGSTVPRIVIRLTGIKTNDTNVTYSDPQFITIRGFKDNATALDAIKSGRVYTIAANDLVFNESNLSPTPNKELIDVRVKVTLASWVEVPVTPEL